MIKKVAALDYDFVIFYLFLSIKYSWYSCVSVVSNVPGSDKLVIIQLVYLDNNRLISQLMRGTAIFWILAIFLQRLLKCFNGTAISTSFVLPAAELPPVIFALNLNDSRSIMLPFRSYLWNCHKLCKIIALLYLINFTTSTFFALSTLVIFISLMDSVNVAQFWNVTWLFLSSVFLAAGSASALVIVMVLFTSMYAS